MNEKQERQRMLRHLVRDNRVASQEELSSLMGQSGFLVAQATLSRDIRELKIFKARDEHGYAYRLPSPAAMPGSFTLSAQAESIESLEFSGSLAVIRTRPGHASMIAAILDGMKRKEIMGTIAGDDTILLILRSNFSQEEVEASFEEIFSGIVGRKTE